METARDLDFGSDEMRTVLEAIERIRAVMDNVHRTHRPLFGGDHYLTGKEVTEMLYISQRTLQEYRDRGEIPFTKLAGKILYKASDIERMLQDNYVGGKAGKQMLSR